MIHWLTAWVFLLQLGRHRRRTKAAQTLRKPRQKNGADAEPTTLSPTQDGREESS